MKRSAAIGRLDAAIPGALRDAHARFIEAVGGVKGGEFLVATYLNTMAMRLVEAAANLVTDSAEDYANAVQQNLALVVAGVSFEVPE